MKIINSSASTIVESNPFKKIEIIGRTCYKSEDKITDDSAIKFVDGLISKKHYAMLEHANVTFEVTCVAALPTDLINMPFVRYSTKYTEDGHPIHYVTLSLSHLYKFANGEYHKMRSSTAKMFNIFFNCFVAKYRNEAVEETELNKYVKPLEVIENGKYIEIINGVEVLSVRVLDDIKSQMLDFDMDDWELHGDYTFKFICDRGVSHELARHRTAVAQESTRYCNYAKSKFGGEVTFIYPSTWDEFDENAKECFMKACEFTERCYLCLLGDCGLSPQQGRAVLPNALKTEVILTMPVFQCIHFFNLRSLGTTGAPHPDMKQVADIAYNIFVDMQNGMATYVENNKDSD